VPQRLLLAGALFALAVGLAVARVGLSIDAAGLRLGAIYVMHDFYATAYDPARAVLEGRSPFDVGYLPFAPTHLLLHLPFALLPPRTAGMAYFLFTVLLTGPLAYLVLRLVRVETEPARVLALAAAVLLSRPGHWTLLVGQLSILLSALAYAAFLHAAARPTLAGWALSATLFKPTYGVPLVLLLWAWGRRKAAVLGVALAAIVNLPLIALLAAREGGLSQLISGALSDFQKFQDRVNPLTSHGRTDATSLISRFVGGPLSTLEQVLLAAGVLLLSAAVLRLLARHTTHNADMLGIGIICLATSLVGYHQGYDLVLLSAPFLAAAMLSSSSAMPRELRAIILALFSIIALNWISTESVIAAVRPSPAMLLVITSVNGLCVAVLFLLYVALGLRYHFHAEEPIIARRQTYAAGLSGR
jgi:hypothetical protein